AAQSWPTPPRYVALAGKGTYDYKNLLGLATNLLPPYLVTTPDGLAPADAELADFDGSGVPGLAIGRIPAVTAADLRAYVDKLAAYESDPGGAWTGQALLAAGPADIGGDFPATSDALAGALAPGLALTRVYLPGSPSPAQVQASRSQLQGALRQGQVLFNYVGHGGLDRLTSEGLLATSDVAQLGNAPRLPVMTALTCLISQFAYPSVSSLGEDLVLQRDGGAAALFGPTWLSHNGPAGDLGRYLMPRLSAPGGGRLGDRLLSGLSAYAAAGGDRETLRVYTLLGDPALALKR
ncbi:MAG TPA: C25 family cysteine peptidase, partial [Thermoanaerobaculia bacterium]|nr:C25 family cysteine peptidase [Thermoanaerobaculia bacterium]